MKSLFAVFALLASPAAFAASSACVVYLDGSTTPVQVQASCDGADLKPLFESTGITAGISKAIPVYLDKGYTLANCTDGQTNANSVSNGYSYARCIFTKR